MVTVKRGSDGYGDVIVHRTRGRGCSLVGWLLINSISGTISVTQLCIRGLGGMIINWVNVMVNPTVIYLTVVIPTRY